MAVTRQGDRHREDVRRRPTLPHSTPCSTIGADRLSFRVRNGAGRFPIAMIAVTLLRCQPTTIRSMVWSGRIPGTAQWTQTRISCLRCNQVVGILVPVSFTSRQSSLPHPAYQPSSLAGSLPRQVSWKPHLEASFPLRCLQRLSHPNVANQRCTWQYN